MSNNQKVADRYVANMKESVQRMVEFQTAHSLPDSTVDDCLALLSEFANAVIDGNITTSMLEMALIYLQNNNTTT